MKKLNKIIYLICIVLIIAAAIVVKTKGMNYSLEYAKTKNVEIVFENEVNKEEIEQIAKEVFGEEIKVSEIENFKDSVAITVYGISDEQKSELINKLNEKYGIELTDDHITITDIAKVKFVDLIKDYIKPTVISLIVIIFFYIIRYRKMNKILDVLLNLVKTALITLAFFSIIVLVRVPIISVYTIPMGLFVAIFVFVQLTYITENEFCKENNK